MKKHEVIVIDNLSTGRIENLDQIIDKINFIHGSITDLELLRRVFAGADTVFHQAAIIRSVLNETRRKIGVNIRWHVIKMFDINNLF